MKDEIEKQIKCAIEPDVWSDFVSGEIRGAYKNDLNAHLESCMSCQNTKKSIERVEGIVRKAQLSIPNDLFFDRLEAKIMAQVKNVKPTRMHKDWLGEARTLIVAIAAMVLLVLTTVFVSDSSKNLDMAMVAKHFNIDANDQLMVEQAGSDVAILNDVILGDVNSDDLVLQAVSQKLANMSEIEMRKLLKETK